MGELEDTQMVGFDMVAKRTLITSVLWAVVFLTGCILASDPPATGTPIVRPSKGAPVTVTLDGQMLIIANNTPEAIYFMPFPSDILPVIEWAPCLAPEDCPAKQRVDPGTEQPMELGSIAAEGTEEITVFWWRFLEKAPGATVPPMEMEEIALVLP